MTIVFFGTPYYVIPVLEKLHKAYKSKNADSPIVAVVTQKPKPAGRKKQLEYSAVDKWAHKKKIPIFYRAQEIIDNDIKADLGILVSYGEIISEQVINHFPNKILNIHPSLLPKFRGSSPVQATIVSGETQTGATIIQLDEKVDHGPIVGQFKQDLLPEDTTETLRNLLFEKSAEVLTTLIPAYISGKIKPRPQEHDKATFTRQLTKQDAFIDPFELKKAINAEESTKDWEIPFVKDLTIHYTPTTIHNFVRAMLPWPIAWTYIKLSPDDKATKRLKLIKSHIVSKTVNGKRSTENILLIDEVQLEGKTPVTWQQFTQGYPHAKF